ncbi:MAG: formylglycine-generating enzyme family protein, partial [Bacteroidaceae bacterium]
DIINENNLRPRPVKTKNANELGIYDMSGNVAEWCQDWAVSYRSNSQINPKETFSGLYRIFRGGDSFKPGLCCRSAFRESETPDSVYRNIGFRLALSE